MCRRDELIAPRGASHRTRRNRASVAPMRRSAPSSYLIVPLAVGIVPHAGSKEHLANDEVNVCKCEQLWILCYHHLGMYHRHPADSESHPATWFRTKTATHSHRADCRRPGAKLEADMDADANGRRLGITRRPSIPHRRRSSSSRHVAAADRDLSIRHRATMRRVWRRIEKALSFLLDAASFEQQFC